MGDIGTKLILGDCYGRVVIRANDPHGIFVNSDNRPNVIIVGKDFLANFPFAPDERLN
jgi:hypothetical protein